MAEVIYATPNMMTKARNTQGEREEGIEDDYDSIESLGDQHQDYVGTEESSNTGNSKKSAAGPLLLGLAVKHKRKTESMDRDVEQLLQRLKNVTEQRDSVLRPQDCACGWTKFGCKCYQVTREWGSWNKCRKLCVSHGVDLVVVDSKEEMDILAGTASEGLWRWVDGTVLSVDNPSWSRGKPDGGKEKNCLRRGHRCSMQSIR
uniref:C-type lectin domain-containing protein n=1 Tax=Gadus morhua TaxID=8049 RepID=A0A8C5AGY6_GADMO